MSTLDLRQPVLDGLWNLPAALLARASEIARAAIEVFAEAQETARAAEQRFPFMMES